MWTPFGVSASIRIRKAIPTLEICLLYFAGAKIGLAMAFLQTNVTPVWPPTGIALAGLLRFGTGVWPGITIAAFLTTYATGVSGTTAGIVAAGNTLAPLAAALVLTRKRGAAFDLGSGRDVVSCVGMSALGTSISATVGTFSLTATGVIPWGAAPVCWWTWWVGDALGMLLVTPVVLSLFLPPQTRSDNPKFGELAALAVALVVTCGVIFWRELSASSPTYSLPYLVLPGRSG